MCVNTLILAITIIYSSRFQTTHGNPSVFTENSLQNSTQTIKNLEDMQVPDSSLILLHRLKYRRTANAYLKTPRKKQQETTQPQEQEEPSRRCVCADGVCTCCTGLVLDLFNQRACMKIMYHPGDFAFDVTMTMNDYILYENSVSGKNPRPICINPPRLNNLKVCAKFYNVFFPGRNLHFCLGMFGRWGSTELFNFSFDCLRMGAQGIAMVKPEDGGGLPVANPQGGVDAVIDAGGDDIEDYDENLVKSLLDAFER